ncbi:hypothetical protein [Sphingomonas sp. TREG-RG-20F-R18-01]|uniref:hypothetical protein n=1 Tax=Sphingomonas sp. TREG-RG-20F-R18-01 TaxID=2914982 RepID=UPI001F56324B|nr:hypothetical protein [Sphingomonas sp. TREG-RG-20F-R18-01]
MLLFAIAAAASPLAPVYLTCSLAQDVGVLRVQIALDEANQSSTVALPSGLTITRPALFSPTMVRIANKNDTWTIDRVTLGIRRTFSFQPKDDPGQSGSCQLQTVPAKRAF